ncbi:MAG TPA: ferrochelatase [Candidatus Limnocylindrales bacterium]
MSDASVAPQVGDLYPHDCPADAPRYAVEAGAAAAIPARPIDRSRQAVLLMAYGSIASLDQVPAYYTHIRGGRAPSAELLEELTERYRAIGGTSPLSDHTEHQRAAVAAELHRRGLDVPVLVGMKHIEPFIGDVVERLAADGTTHVVAMALAPHFSTMSACAYCHAVAEGRDAAAAAGPAGLTFEMVRDWHAEPRFIRALAAATYEALDALWAAGSSARSNVTWALGSRLDTHVVFTAHSLPARILERHDPYPELLRETADLVASALGLHAWSFAFQSAGRTADPWLGPDLTDHLRVLAAQGVREAVVCPVGFVADHLEVLYDIDIEAQAVAAELGLTLERARSMNDDPVFVAGIADVLERRLAPAPAPADSPDAAATAPAA